MTPLERAEVRPDDARHSDHPPLAAGAEIQQLDFASPGAADRGEERGRY